MLVALQVSNKEKDGSDYVVFITLLAQVIYPIHSAMRMRLTHHMQLYGPLNSLGYIYRSINQNLVDTERLMKLLDEPTEVNDKPDAGKLSIETGEIEFRAFDS